MKKYWPALDGLRAFAVFIVLFAHAGVPFPRSGGVGVDLFFVLSGFLITGILSRDFARHGKIRLGNFYTRRFLRLAPCLVLTCTLFGLIAWFEYGFVPFRQIAIALTYTANWARALFDADLSSLAHCWTLAIEEQYYLFWPFVVLGLERLTGNDARKWQILLAAAGVLALYRWQMVGTYSAGRIYFGLDTHMDGLVVGSALSYFLKGSAKLKSGTHCLLSYVLAPLAILGVLALMQFVTWRDPWMGRWGFALAAIAGVVIIADLVASPRCLYRKFCSVRPMVYLGRISYGLYLLHFPLYTLLNHHFPENWHHLLVPTKIALSIVVASLSFYLVEMPFLKLKKRFV